MCPAETGAKQRDACCTASGPLVRSSIFTWAFPTCHSEPGRKYTFGPGRLRSMASQSECLRAEDQFRWLAVHLVRHVCHRPLWLIDLAVMMETAGEEMDWDLCLRGSHVWRRWLLAVAGLAGRLLGARLPSQIAKLPGVQPAEWLVSLTLWRWGGGDALRGRELFKRRDEWWPYLAHKVLNPVRWAYRLGLPPMRFVPPIWGASIMARSLQPYPRIWRALAKRRRSPGLFPIHEQRVF